VARRSLLAAVPVALTGVVGRVTGAVARVAGVASVTRVVRAARAPGVVRGVPRVILRREVGDGGTDAALAVLQAVDEVLHQLAEGLLLGLAALGDQIDRRRGGLVLVLGRHVDGDVLLGGRQRHRAVLVGLVVARADVAGVLSVGGGDVHRGVLRGLAVVRDRHDGLAVGATHVEREPLGGLEVDRLRDGVVLVLGGHLDRHVLFGGVEGDGAVPVGLVVARADVGGVLVGRGDVHRSVLDRGVVVRHRHDRLAVGVGHVEFEAVGRLEVGRRRGGPVLATRRHVHRHVLLGGREVDGAVGVRLVLARSRVRLVLRVDHAHVHRGVLDRGVVLGHRDRRFSVRVVDGHAEVAFGGRDPGHRAECDDRDQQ